MSKEYIGEGVYGTQGDKLRKRLMDCIESWLGDVDRDRMVGVVNEMLHAVSEEIEQVEVPINIEDWMGTKKHLSEATSIGLAKWFRTPDEHKSTWQDRDE